MFIPLRLVFPLLGMLKCFCVRDYFKDFSLIEEDKKSNLSWKKRNNCALIAVKNEWMNDRNRGSKGVKRGLRVVVSSSQPEYKFLSSFPSLHMLIAISPSLCQPSSSLKGYLLVSVWFLTIWSHILLNISTYLNMQVLFTIILYEESHFQFWSIQRSTGRKRNDAKRHL